MIQKGGLLLRRSISTIAPSNSRIRFLSLFFIVVSVLVLAKLFTWQVVKGAELKEIGRKQHRISSAIPAHRGSILASDNYPLVYSSEAWLIWAALPDLESIDNTVKLLAPYLAPEPKPIEETATKSAQPVEPTKTKEELVKDEENRLRTLLTKEGVVWVPLKHKTTKEVKAQIETHKLKGIGFDLEETRGYPEGTMAAHVLGFLGKDSAGQDAGYFGLEGFYDLTLSGSSGEKAWEKDAFGKPILLGVSRKVTALDGLDIKTNIDRTIQYTIEKHLELGIEKYGASEGSIIVMRPQDGAVLALASFPSYDPSKFGEYEGEEFTNPAISESFEPGSVFKVLVMASALDAKAVTPEDKCDICKGPHLVSGYSIGTWDDKYYPNSTTAEIIQHSDNVGMVWTAQRLGLNKMYEYLTGFGIGKTTGIDLQGEANPPLRKYEDWSAIDLATASFGQGVAITPIQMARAVSAIAAGGRVPIPQVVKEISITGFTQTIKPKYEGRVISAEAAKTMTEMMVNAVKAGEAKWAAPKGFKIAGKTGTAQIPVAGHYDADKTIASFVGFAPADDPKFVMLITLREPQSSPWASETAAPLWFSISKELFPYFGVQPEN